MKLLIPIILIIIIFISFRCDTRNEHFQNNKTSNTENPSPSENPAPSEEPVSEEPAPFEEPAPSEESVFEAPVETELSIFGFNNAELRKKIKNLITKILGYAVELMFKENGKKLVIKMPDIEYESITDNHKLKIKKEILELIHEYLNKKYKTTKDKKFSINKNRINVIVFPGSTYIVIQILDKAQVGELSDTDKEMLEYHNFMGVLRGGRAPIRESDFASYNYNFKFGR